MNTLAAMMMVMPLAGGFGGSKNNCGSCEAPVPPVPQIAPPMFTPNCPPSGPPQQVLATKIVLPEGASVTAFPGTAQAKAFSGNPIFGLRPGYLYRFKIESGPVTLYPEIEVRGTLVLRPSMKLMDHFTAVAFSARDLERAATGAIITKVIYLEDPLKALAVKTDADHPHEMPDDSEKEAIKAAMENGRLVAIVRLGNRVPDNETLAKFAVPGTILLPGENYLPQASVPPYLGFQGVNLFDPILGPKFPHEECFTDGGDTVNKLGVRDDGRLGGLDVTDTAAQFKAGGKAGVVTSNTVCICVPRFIVRRVEQGANGYTIAQMPQASLMRQPPAMLRSRTPPVILVAREKPMGLLEMIHPQIIKTTQRTQQVVSTVGVKAVYQVESLRVVKQLVEPEEVQNADEFLLTKEVDPKEGVKIGDEVTVTLRYRNRTGKPVTDLVVSDSLSARLEYVPGTAVSDRPTNVTTSTNEAGSVVVRFELPGTLLPGQGGVVQFKAKVR